MRFKFLLKPGWLALTLAVWVFAGACVYFLSPWQFGRNDERQQQNSAITKSLKSDPAQFGAQHDEWQKVEIKGRYLPELEALARLRTVQGEAAFEVITPFETTTGQRILIDRGYVRPVNGIKPPDFAAPPDNEVTLIGLARPNESNEQPAFDQDGRKQIYAINNNAVGREHRARLLPAHRGPAGCAGHDAAAPARVRAVLLLRAAVDRVRGDGGRWLAVLHDSRGAAGWRALRGQEERRSRSPSYLRKRATKALTRPAAKPTTRDSSTARVT